MFSLSVLNDTDQYPVFPEVSERESVSSIIEQHTSSYMKEFILKSSKNVGSFTGK
jgi:hypothetical protein